MSKHALRPGSGRSAEQPIGAAMGSHVKGFEQPAGLQIVGRQQVVTQGDAMAVDRGLQDQRHVIEAHSTREGNAI